MKHRASLIIGIILSIVPVVKGSVVLSTDFTGVVRTTTPTATGISWTTSNLTLASNNLLISKESGDGAPALYTSNNEDRVGVMFNVETGTSGRSWSTTFTFTTSASLSLTSFGVDFHAVSGSGANQSSATKNGDFSFSLFAGSDTSGTQLYTGLEDNLAETSAALGAEASYDLSGLTDLVAGTYTGKIQVAAGNETTGNNWAMDDIVLNADLITIPEPSCSALLGLAGLGLLCRRRK